MTCSNTFQPPHYGLGGKCFPSIGITKLSNRDLSFTLKDFPTSLKLNHNIAAKDALAYGSYSVGLMTQARDLYSHDYVDLTPVATNDITYIMLTRRTNDLTNSDRYIDAPLCERNSSYDRKECSRWFFKLTFFNFRRVLYQLSSLYLDAQNRNWLQNTTTAQASSLEKSIREPATAIQTNLQVWHTQISGIWTNMCKQT